MRVGSRANPYAGRARKINPQILCGAGLLWVKCGVGQPALPPLVLL